MSRDPWSFQRWAHQTKTRGPAGKSVLTFLATMADKESGRCEAKQVTLAQGTQLSERSVRTHLSQLEADGLIARRPQFRTDRGRRGDEFLLLADGIAEWPDGQPATVHPADTAGGAPRQLMYPPHGTPAAAQEQPPKEQATPTEVEGARAPTAVKKNPDYRERVPDDFPDELRPHARAVMKVLQRVAEEHGTRKVWPAAVAKTIMTRPRRPLVRTAHSLEVWAVDPPRPIQDVVGTYRTFLDRERDLAGLERLDEQGNPAAGGPVGTVGPGGTVHPLRGESPRDRQLRERQERDDASLAALQEMSAELGIGDANRKEDRGAG